MRYATLSMTIILLAVVSPSHGQNWAEKMFATRSHDFGYVPRDAKAEFAFVMKNTYMGDIHIAGVHSSCGCATPRIEKQLLKTYEQTAIVAKLNTERLRGRQSSTITVRIDKPARASVQLHIKAFIYDAVTFDPSAVQFGSVAEGTAAEETVAVTYRRGTQWKIREVQSASPFLSATAAERKRGAGQVVYDIHARLDPGAPRGYFQGQLMLVTNDPRAVRIPLRVEGQVAGALSVSPTSVFLGVVQPQQVVSKKIIVRAKKPFTIKSVKADCNCLRGAVSGASTEAKRLHLVEVSFTARGKPGRVAKALRIETDLPNGVAEVTVFAVVPESTMNEAKTGGNRRSLPSLVVLDGPERGEALRLATQPGY